MKKVLSFIIMSCLVLSTVLISNAAMQTITNETLWKDTNGNTIKAQGGCIFKEGNTYHWFGPDFAGGTDYNFYAINHYTSTDLKNWTYQTGGRITVGMPTIPFQTGSWVGRPWIMWHAATSRYVMVIEWGAPEGSGYRNQFAFLTSTNLNATNAWTYQSSKLISQLPDSTGTKRNLGDLGVYQEGNNAWLLYTFDYPQQNYSQAILKLDPADFMTPLAPTSGNYWQYTGSIWPDEIREAASVFKYNGTYYYFTSACNGWPSSKTRYRTATNMAGPWSALADVPTSPASEDSFNTQHDFVLPVTGTSGTAFIYCGDRWSNYTGGDQSKGYYQWSPITFNGSVPTINGHTNWQIDTVTGTWQPVPTQTNLLQNPGFENDFANWTKSGNASIATASAEVHQPGIKAVKMYSASPYTTNLSNSVTNVSAGTYTAKVWSRGGGTFSVRKYNVYVNGNQVVSYSVPLSTTYTQYTASNSINVPAGATVKVEIALNAGGGAWTQFDDFSLIKN